MDERPTPHGYELEPELHRALRSAVPPEAVRWVEVESGATLVAQQPLEGGNSSAMHRLTLRTTCGSEQSVVLRRYVLDWVIEEPEIPGNEALALTLLADRRTVPAPALLAADPDGSQTGVPSILMSSLPGTVVWEPADLETWLRALAEQLPIIHARPLDSRLADWAPYAPEPGIPPVRTRYREAWETAVELWQAGPPPGDRVFLHRDYHPGNVLWTRATVTGIVDWVSACAGPPEEDVAHCRANLATHHGQAAADRFLDYWLAAAGRDGYDPYYDLTTVVSLGGGAPSPALDHFVGLAAARLS